ncbi:glucose dehydrogenase [FAD, quinone]-like [Toxorhynchites rutilus septentrionalis]|uniref:glucose dehydrogenase [FAD, quinone]-like n=1 Tax=Toxorhynchites rutilus septentrionalis TaxID=329112 RepID=UPI00247903E6|nr:glucose dehydrogenase [FAD, quinone]-like [Toxorhynchites rutilus septentrionalis]
MCGGRVNAVTVLATFMAICCLPSNIEGQNNDRLMEGFFQRLASIQEELNLEPSTNDLFDDTERKDSVKNMLNQYDFVIIGASPSGCVLANRLSENPEWKVLLLEAGEHENIFVKIPVFAAYLQSTSYNWGYVAERQNYSCWGMKDQRCALPRGKGLGGSTLINYMMYVRGNRDDFNRWADAGNPGWAYRDVLPYFKKSEKSFLNISNDYHGSNGLLDVRFAPYQTKMSHIFVNSLQELGMPLVDYNGENQLGVSHLHSNLRGGKRLSASAAFLEPVFHRANLHILTNARVTKVLINHDTKTAYGAEFVRDKKRYVVKAKKEVILAAGGLQSPQLLMLSGVGPAEHLREIGIPVIKNLPVGRAFYDHLYYTGLVFSTNTRDFTLHLDRTVSLPELAKYLKGGGEMTIPGGVEAVGFINTRNRSQDAVPDIELIFVNGSPASDYGSGVRRGLRMSDPLYGIYRPLESGDRDAFMVNLVLLHPKSKGYMELKSSNPFQWPKFYTNFLKEEEDLETLLSGIKRATQIMDTPTMKRFNTKLHDIPVPNCAHLGFGRDDYWRCTIRTQATSLYHQTGTCKMGPAYDREAVVSPELKVHGIDNLRVADVGVIPVTLSGHPVAIAYLIGEKLADLLKEQWR